MTEPYYMPTRVIAGEGCIEEQREALAALGSKALIVTGRHSAIACGALRDVTAALEANGQAYAVYDRVTPNPTIDCVYDGADFARREGADCIVAIGGGSPMDAAKAMALLAAQNVPPETLFTGPYGKAVLPMAFVPTTAGTGSEVTQYAILTNDRLETKSTVAAPFLFPTIAFVDSRYLDGLSVATRINTALDALSHLVEGFLSARAGVLSDGLALQGMALLGPRLSMLNQAAPLARADLRALSLASTLGGMVIANTATTVVHAMGYGLTYFKDIDHGRANGLLLCAYLERVEAQKPEKVRQVLDALDMPDLETLTQTLDTLLGARETVTPDEARKVAAAASRTKHMVNGVIRLTEADLLDIFQQAFYGTSRNSAPVAAATASGKAMSRHLSGTGR